MEREFPREGCTEVHLSECHSGRDRRHHSQQWHPGQWQEGHTLKPKRNNRLLETVPDLGLLQGPGIGTVRRTKKEGTPGREEGFSKG